MGNRTGSGTEMTAEGGRLRGQVVCVCVRKEKGVDHFLSLVGKTLSPQSKLPQLDAEALTLFNLGFTPITFS